MRIVGIDAGYVNFAVCGIDTRALARPYYWKNSPLFKGKFSEERLIEAIQHWINQPEIRELLDGADQIVLERQMTMKFQAVNHCVRFNYFDKTVEVNPRTIGAFFRLPADRPGKKKDAVQLVTRNTVFPIRKGKKDDLADAYLLAAFHAFSSNPTLREGWIDERPPGRQLSKPSRPKGQTRSRAKRAAADGESGDSSGHSRRPAKRVTIDLVADLSLSTGEPA
jgi:hypothetical protein